MMRSIRELLEFAIPLVTVFLIIGIGWVAFSIFEARAYERVTGKKVAVIDAMFLNLRVQEPAR